MDKILKKYLDLAFSIEFKFSEEPFFLKNFSANLKTEIDDIKISFTLEKNNSFQISFEPKNEVSDKNVNMLIKQLTKNENSFFGMTLELACLSLMPYPCGNSFEYFEFEIFYYRGAITIIPKHKCSTPREKIVFSRRLCAIENTVKYYI